MLKPFILSSIVALGLGCTTRETDSVPKNTEKAASDRNALPIPGFELLGSPQARRKADVLARYGPPASEEKVRNGRYSLLAYPVGGWNEKLLILFAGDDLLGFSRESSRTVLDSTMQHHARDAEGSVVLLQSWVDGQTSYFRAPREQLEKAPKRKIGSPPPLSEAKALELAGHWRTQNNPGPTAQPTIQDIHEVPQLPGTAFYVVGIFDFQAKRMTKIVILMDGTIITGEAD